MIFELLVWPCAAAPECPLDQSYASALNVSFHLEADYHREGELTRQRSDGCG